MQTERETKEMMVESNWSGIFGFLFDVLMEKERERHDHDDGVFKHGNHDNTK